MRGSGNLHSRPGTVALVACLLAAAVAVGPRAVQAGQKQAEKSGKTLAEFEKNVQAIQTQIDSAVGSLNQIVEQANTDPRPPYKQYTKDRETLVSLAKKAKGNLDKMKATGQAYFENWEKEMGTVTNPDMKARAEQRKAQLQEYFTKVQDSLAGGMDKWTQFKSDTNDINTVLANDLTPAGINSIKDIITKVSADGETIKSKLSDILAAIAAFKNELSPTPQAAAGGSS